MRASFKRSGIIYMQNTNNLNLMELAMRCPNAIIQINMGDLCEFAHQLINNATEAGAKTIECRWHESALRISNDGTPIPAEARRDIFIPFYTTKSTGTGIGLALSRQIITMLGGSIELSEKADAGYHTTFILGFEQ